MVVVLVLYGLKWGICENAYKDYGTLTLELDHKILLADIEDEAKLDANITNAYGFINTLKTKSFRLTKKRQ